MENAKKALAELQTTFKLLATQSCLVREGKGDLHEIERLLNSTLELPEILQSIAFSVCMMASIGPGRVGYEKLTEFAVNTNHQALLLLLVDGPTVEHILGLVSILKVKLGGPNRIYSVERLRDLPVKTRSDVSDEFEYVRNKSVRHSGKHRNTEKTEQSHNKDALPNKVTLPIEAATLPEQAGPDLGFVGAAVVQSPTQTYASALGCATVGPPLPKAEHTAAVTTATTTKHIANETNPLQKHSNEQRNKERGRNENEFQRGGDNQRRDGQLRDGQRRNGQQRDGQRRDSQRSDGQRSDGQRRNGGQRSDDSQRSNGQHRDGQRRDGQRRDGQRRDGQRRDSQRRDGQHQDNQRQNGLRRDNLHRATNEPRRDNHGQNQNEQNSNSNVSRNGSGRRARQNTQNEPLRSAATGKPIMDPQQCNRVAANIARHTAEYKTTGGSKRLPIPPKYPLSFKLLEEHDSQSELDDSANFPLVDTEKLEHNFILSSETNTLVANALTTDAPATDALITDTPPTTDTPTTDMPPINMSATDALATNALATNALATNALATNALATNALAVNTLAPNPLATNVPAATASAARPRGPPKYVINWAKACDSDGDN